VTFSTVVAESRDAVLDLADKYRDPATFERAATLAWTQAQVQLHHLGVETDEAICQRSPVIPGPRSAGGGCAARNEQGHPGQGPRHPASTHRVVRIDGPDGLDIVRQRSCHEYWRLKLLTVDLVIVNEQATSYAQDLQEALETIVRTSQSALAPEGRGTQGGVHLLRGDQLSADDRTLLQTAARAVLLSRRGSLAEQVIRLERPRSDRSVVPRQPGSHLRGRGRRPRARRAVTWLGGRAEQAIRLERTGRNAASTSAGEQA
jgi:cyclic beta-1,2-glucan synthetase